MLISDGHEVVSLSRHLPSGTDRSESPVKYVTADVFDRSAIFRVLEQESPRAVLHLLTDLKQRSSAANARIREVGTRNLVEAAKAAGTSKMVAQSIAWAYEPGEEAATESTAFDFAAPQPRKTTIDGIVALEGTVGEMHEHTTLRLGTLYGAGTWYDRDGANAQIVKEGKMLATNAITNFLHIVDAASAFLKALTWPVGPVNIVDDDPAPALIWLPEYAREIGAPAPQEDAGSVSSGRAVSNRKAYDLGWMPAHRSWRGGFLV